MLLFFVYVLIFSMENDLSFPEHGETHDTADLGRTSIAFTGTTVFLSSIHPTFSVIRYEGNQDFSSIISPAGLALSARLDTANGYSHAVEHISQRGARSGAPVPKRRFP
jgi:hypothetical protein